MTSFLSLVSSIYDKTLITFVNQTDTKSFQQPKRLKTNFILKSTDLNHSYASKSAGKRKPEDESEPPDANFQEPLLRRNQ